MMHKDIFLTIIEYRREVMELCKSRSLYTTESGPVSVQVRLLIAIPMVTTKKITKIYTEKEMRASKVCTRKKNQTEKKAVLEDLRHKEDVTNVENKQQNGINPFLSAITLNVTGLNPPIKRQRVTE